MKLARDRCAVLLVDLQRAFCDDRGSMAAHGRDIGRLRRAVYVSHRLAGAARKAGVPVAWTRMAFAPDYADAGLLVRELRPDFARIGALRADTPDVELAAGADRDEDEPIFDRTRFSALVGTHLEDWLRAAAIDTVVVAGVTTSLAVESTVRDLAQRDFKVFVVREACADFDDAAHEAAFAAMAAGFARVVGEGDVTAAWFARGGRDFPRPGT
ncbi:MAG: isochorismatase family cysteine hydrolase [Burkholderiales bacterium]